MIKITQKFFVVPHHWLQNGLEMVKRW